MAMNVERSTCAELYKFADVFSVDIVQKRCLQWIARHFTEVASSEEFYIMSVAQLTNIISHDELDVKEEITVWEAVVRWVQHSREDRLHHLPSILPHIRFNLLPSDDKAAILDHPLVRNDPGSSEVIRNVVQKWNLNLKPRLGMTTEMAILYCGSRKLLFMNPQEGKYISCRYSREDMSKFSAMTVTSDNDIYILDTEELDDDENQLSLFKYNHAKNVWELAGVSTISHGPIHEFSHCQELLFEVDRNLYYLAVDREIDRPLLQLRKYNQNTKQWQECSSLQLNETLCSCATLSCGSYIYFLTNSAVYCYDSSQDRWSERTPPYIEVCTAVVMGTEIFCTDCEFTQTLVYDTESDNWQELQGWPNPNPESLDDDSLPILFVVENQLHILLICDSDSQEGIVHLVYVYDKSTDAWRELKANMPNKEYFAPGSFSPVARMYLPHLKGT
ncbi:kelch repeat and BTB domain-containing protein 8-like [Branchiostoma floridae]|uniref:Kelch repeat and BTB domain-containing protein 8-like n=1 Tax=Branchiostoma floridae TaxID=7739 RepID=A0A9J7N321_BRAFL|nr:kelch repeat and BTB domain-containing protein 8-like [Branchiostoma floridae]